jgi:hypothetical protein
MAALYVYRLVTDPGGAPPGEGDRDGATYVQGEDFIRLNRQQRLVWEIMKDGQWRTLREIAALARAPETSVSARLRDFRKARFGGSEVQRMAVDAE